jgi:RimJ/RimL family protein N-acetyltransferase
MQNKLITKATIEALSRNFYKEAHDYGFKYEDYVKFVNSLLDLAITNNNGHTNRTDTSEEEFIKNIKIDKMPLECNELLVDKFSKSKHKNLIEEWMKDEEGRYFLLSIGSARFMSIEELLDNKFNRIGIIQLKDKTPIGMTAFVNFDQEQKKAELRKIIGDPTMRGKGFAKKASRLWIQYGLKTLGLHKIYLNTINTNIRNVKLNEKLGFRVEGVLHNELYFDGEYHDVLRMGMVNDSNGNGSN